MEIEKAQLRKEKEQHQKLKMAEYKHYADPDPQWADVREDSAFKRKADFHFDSSRKICLQAHVFRE